MGIATAVANALHYANRNGVIHRDIKPANILLHDGQLVVADFGIALAIGIAGGTRLTETGLSVGTPYYMSPEQATGDQIVGPQSDIYSLGAILYEMLIGEPPYTGATAQAVLGRILQGKPVSATEKRASVPRNVDACIRKSLERIPADRFATGQDMARALADSSFRSTSDTPAISATATLTRNAPLMGALAALGLIVGVFGWLRPASPEVVSRYELTPPNGEQVQGLNFAFGLAPGGDRIVFAASIGDDETARLWIKQRDRLEWAPVPGSEGGIIPRVSPDGTHIVYLVPGGGTNAGTFVIPVDGGTPTRISDEAKMAAWIDQDRLAIAPFLLPGGAKIEEVSSKGGTPRELWSSDTLVVFGAISALPDGRGILFPGCSACPVGVRVFALDGATGEAHEIGEGVQGAYLDDGNVLLTRIDGSVWVAPFNLKRLEFDAPPIPVVQGIATGAIQSGLLASPDGTLLMLLGPGARAEPGRGVDDRARGRAGQHGGVWPRHRGLSNQRRFDRSAASDHRIRRILAEAVAGRSLARLCLFGIRNERALCAPISKHRRRACGDLHGRGHSAHVERGRFGTVLRRASRWTRSADDGREGRFGKWFFGPVP